MEFATAWFDKVSKLQGETPQREAFRERYGKYVPNVDYTGGPLTGEYVLQSISKMGNSVPGLGGWRIGWLT